MPTFEPTKLAVRGDTLAVAQEGGVSALRPGAQPRPFAKEPMIYRPERLTKIALEVLQVITDASLALAVREFVDDDFTPKAGALAPEHFRRRKYEARDWPLEGLVGQTGDSNFRNMVNGAVKGGLKQIEQSQNNGKWVLESGVPDFDTRGERDILTIKMVFVDLNNAEDLEWEDGAPRKATKPTVQVLVQREGGDIEAQPQTGGGRRGLRSPPKNGG